jgi:hypothetical protein
MPWKALSHPPPGRVAAVAVPTVLDEVEAEAVGEDGTSLAGRRVENLSI